MCFRSEARRIWIAAALAACLLLPAAASDQASALPPNFQETVAFSGLANPTAIEFSQDGRIFIAEKSGLIKVYDGLQDGTPTTFADLRTEVHNYWDRGMLGMVLDPGFPADPYVYVLYTRDAMPGGTPPRWGQPGASSDGCPDPTGDGCVVTGRLTRLTATGNAAAAESPLITDWCQQYPSHTTGGLAFGADGALYASGGDGASFNWVDWGQDGNPVNPCGDPPGGVGGSMTPPTAEGGALRSQDARTTSDPTGLNGAILRVDPATGAGLPGNPFFADGGNRARIAAIGQRNPFRITVRPGTSEVWSGDVGWNDWEEINRVTVPTGSAENFGWPCYEGSNTASARQSGYDGANLSLCESLYTPGDGNVARPYFAYRHETDVVPGEGCNALNGSAISGLDFYTGGDFPNAYNGALFFADYSRDCIWAMLPDGSGLPNRDSIETFNPGATNPVELEVGPQGDLFYADLDGGTIRRISHISGNAPPVAVASATPASGSPPLQVQLSATGSSDANAEPLAYSWDLDDDGQFDDSSAATLTRTYADPGLYTPSVRVTDPHGASDTAEVRVQVGPPVAEITAPSDSLRWAVNEQIGYSGTATDPQEGTLPESAYHWTITLNHCPSNCHQHVIEEPEGSASGTFIAPDHEYPSSLTFRLEVTDEHGLTDSDEVTVDPRTVGVSLKSQPPGMKLGLDSRTEIAPFTSIAIEGSQHTVVAPPEQTVGGQKRYFRSWSDGGAATHAIVAGSDVSLEAIYGAKPLADVLGRVRHGCGGRVATVVGTKRAEVLRGTRRADVIVALGGRDEVRARGGADIVCGGGGPDRLAGGKGKDRLHGGEGRDRLAGGGGADSCSGGRGADRGTACEKGKSLVS